MGYSFSDKVKMLICKLFNHFPRDQWEYEGTHANCACCSKVITKHGKKWQ